jgi:hypothetical protein
LIGRGPNTAYFVSLVRIGRHLDGHIAISEVGATPQGSGVALIGVLHGQRFTFRLTSNVLGVRTLLGRIVGRDLILVSSRTAPITLRPGGMPAYTRLYDHLVASAQEG